MLAFETQTGTYTGTGAAQSVTLGYRPMLLIIFNETDGDVINFKLGAQAGDDHVSIGTATALVSSGGITLSNTGFSVGTDNSVSENAKVFRYVAFGSQTQA